MIIGYLDPLGWVFRVEGLRVFCRSSRGLEA